MQSDKYDYKRTYIAFNKKAYHYHPRLMLEIGDMRAVILLDYLIRSIRDRDIPISRSTPRLCNDLQFTIADLRVASKVLIDSGLVVKCPGLGDKSSTYRVIFDRLHNILDTITNVSLPA